MQLRARAIKEVLDDRGRGIVSRWVEKELTNVDQANIEARFNQIELNQTENPKWVKYYKSLKMWEIRLSSSGKALRFLCEKEVNQDVILLVGCVKRGQISGTATAQAKERRDLYRKGKLNVRDYPLPQRPPVDVEKSRR